jgi:hypothetical protein
METNPERAFTILFLKSLPSRTLHDCEARLSLTLQLILPTSFFRNVDFLCLECRALPSPSTLYRTRSFLNLVFKRSHVLKLKLHHFFLSRKNLMFSSKGVVGVGENVAGKGVKLLCREEKKNLCLVP